VSHRIRAEFLIEPFEEGNPGPHVTKAIAAIEEKGLEVKVEAFGNIVVGATDEVASALAEMLKRALAEGAARVSIQVSANGTQESPAMRAGGLHGALDRLIEQVAAELGGPLTELSREKKQAAIRILDERGAFLLRKSIEEVADAMDVSRITIYNYLNALR
jgi:uncharacterized protein YqgV (UPF0045/DUF77 family)